MRVLFVNENIGGHATVHANLRAMLPAHPEVEAEFLDVPKASGWRRLAGTSLPGLGGLDLDLQALRAQLALSTWVRGQVRRRMHRFDVLHVYTGNAGLRSADLLASMPSVVTTDATNVSNGYRLPGRVPTRFTPGAVRAAKRWETPVYGAASLVVANTDWIARSLREDYDVPDSRLRVFPFGIAAPDFADGPAPGVVRSETLPQLVFVGRQLERKGALRLLQLHQQYLADDCELVIVSNEVVPEGRNVRAVNDVTVGSGRLWEVLRDGAAFVFPSIIDQAPNAVLEAMAAGLPVVGLTVAAMPETVPPSCGILVEPSDDAALVAVHPQTHRAIRSCGPSWGLPGAAGSCRSTTPRSRPRASSARCTKRAPSSPSGTASHEEVRGPAGSRCPPAVRPRRSRWGSGARLPRRGRGAGGG